ncbi:hypothetical protein PFISCL1PPCAC_4681, partial [Pristionchus fissidentatus]
EEGNVVVLDDNDDDVPGGSGRFGSGRGNGSAEDLPPITDDDDSEMLEFLQITPEHIRANGTLHTSPFAGLAELIDNAVDSSAKNVSINRETVTREVRNKHYTKDDSGSRNANKKNSKPNKTAPSKEAETIRETEDIIYVLDDGSGMDRKETLNTILVGYSLKRGNVNTIGQFGNGLKSGSMRLGDTMLLITKKANEFTILLISLKYLDDMHTLKCYVPCISLVLDEDDNFKMMCSLNYSERKHNYALDVILNYSPFNTKQMLYAFVGKITSETGTMVAVSGLKRLENGRPEIKYYENIGDFAVDKRDDHHKLRRLSNYLQKLYLEPKVNITIQGRMVNLQDPKRALAHRRWAYLFPGGLKEFAKRELLRLEMHSRNARDTLGKKERECIALFKRIQDCDLSHNSEQHKAMTRDLRMNQEQKNELSSLKEEIDRRIENMKKGKPGSELRIFLGMNLSARYEMEATFYSNGRKIISVPLDKRARGSSREALGVSCIIDIPSTLLPPSQNKENFETPSELKFLMNKVNTAAKEYFLYAPKEYKTGEFWKSIGYADDKPETRPNTERPMHRKILEITGARKFCSKCRAFRVVTITEETPVPFPPLFPTADYSCPNTELAKGGGSKRVCAPSDRNEKIAMDIQQFTKTGTKMAYVSVKSEEPSYGWEATERKDANRKPSTSNKRRVDEDEDDEDSASEDHEELQSTSRYSKNGAPPSSRTRTENERERGRARFENSPDDAAAPRSVASTKPLTLNFTIPKKGQSSRKRRESSCNASEIVDPNYRESGSRHTTIKKKTKTAATAKDVRMTQVRNEVKREMEDEDEPRSKKTKKYPMTSSRGEEIAHSTVMVKREAVEEMGEDEYLSDSSSVQWIGDSEERQQSKAGVDVSPAAGWMENGEGDGEEEEEVDLDGDGGQEEQPSRYTDGLMAMDEHELRDTVRDQIDQLSRVGDVVREWMMISRVSRGDPASALELEEDALRIEHAMDPIYEMEQVLKRRREEAGGDYDQGVSGSRSSSIDHEETI